MKVSRNTEHIFRRNANAYNTFQQIPEKQKTSWNTTEVENLDKDFQRAGKYAAAKCKMLTNVPMALALGKKRKEKYVLKRHISAIKNYSNLNLATKNLTSDRNLFTIPKTSLESITRIKINFNATMSVELCRNKKAIWSDFHLLSHMSP